MSIEVASVEDPPVAASFSRSPSEDTPAAITLQGSDGDGDAVSYAIASLPAHGSLGGTAPALTYTPAKDYSGPDSFTYTVSSSDVTSTPGTVTLQVTAVNDPPAAVDSAVPTDEDTQVAITLQASDVDNPTLSFTIVTPPSDGTCPAVRARTEHIGRRRTRAGRGASRFEPPTVRSTRPPPSRSRSHRSMTHRRPPMTS